ncbi:cardiolipin synthase [Aurantibacter crassamenti]|uniref:cardiolipin synthase n=1 Tax=Aurantibacter crassamenti TaxID=1837375 RepID=UPI0019394486|nr:cardiolipin synthase [Aurantibacter crassamenti]MBM1106594.1 cardiolipin synthase [Aurantibacter crassamenti]
MWVSLIFLLYILLALFIVFTILLYGAKPSKTLAWLLAIFTIPVGGILLYLLLGRNRRKNKLLKLKNDFSVKPPIQSHEILKKVNDEHKKLEQIIYKNCGFPSTSQNRLESLKNGKKTFEAIFNALNEAEHCIHLQYYIFEEGILSERLFRLFDAKIKQGVQIRMIYDSVGSFSLSKPYLKRLLTIGVEAYPFLPFKFGHLLRTVNYRNHRKIIIVDGQVAFTGGINVSDKYLKGDPTLGKWHDMHLKIQGEAAAHLDYVFATDWYLVSQKLIEPYPTYKIFNTVDFNSLVQIVYGGPDDDFSVLEQVYFTMINGAKKYLYITNPYIIPGQALLQALQTAALGGVDVRLMISEKVDSKLVGWCVRSYFGALLKSGVKIYLFPDGFLHSKIIISDDTISTIGTANLDDRSLELNYEVNAIIYDVPFSIMLKNDFLKDSNTSRLLSYQEHLERPWSEKLKEGFGKVFSPLL